MLHFGPSKDGKYQIGYDESDKEVARLAALEEGMNPDHLFGDCFLDFAQIVAREAGFMITPWDRGDREDKEGKGVIFPYGCFWAEMPNPEDDKETAVRKMKESFRPCQKRGSRRRVTRR